MATAAVQLPTPSYNRVEGGSCQLKAASFPEPKSSSSIDSHGITSEWVSHLTTALNSDFSGINNLFLHESYWRDQLGLSWDYHTLHGPDDIVAFLQKAPHDSRIKAIQVDDSSDFRKPKAAPIDFDGKLNGITSFLDVETDVGRGKGIVRLLQDAEDGRWKAFTLFTAMHELKGYEETINGKRPHGVDHGGKPGRKVMKPIFESCRVLSSSSPLTATQNWQERRTETENFEGDLEPTVLILGAGQGGLTSAARLQQLQIPTLIVDRNPRIGDNWRNRYHQLVLHDPVWYDHLPYLPFPPNWPTFTPKDKLAEWFESYVRLLELNVWTSTTVESASWDDSKRQWTVNLRREQASTGKAEQRILHPKHIIQATGHSGEMQFPKIKGMDSFAGNLCHSSQFKGAGLSTPEHKKHAIVVGSCNSGHDIAQDFYEHGYDVTMVQRSSTFVVSSNSMMEVMLGGLYDETGPPTEDADLSFLSIPNPVLKRMHMDATKEISRRDKDLIQGLERAGFKTDQGPDGSGFFMKYFQRGGGYYIDVGCSQLIIDGKIKVKQGQEILEVKPHSLTFADGTELPADEIIFATGYENMRGTARKIFGNELAERVKDVWGFDDEGELRTMWRKTGHPGFWFFGGNLALCRYFSRMLALQIKAMEEGIMKYEDP